MFLLLIGGELEERHEGQGRGALLPGQGQDEGRRRHDEDDVDEPGNLSTLE